MEYNAELIKKFYLYTETFKLSKEEDNFVILIQNEKCWETMLNISLENVTLKEHFFSLTPEEREEFLFFGIACLTCFVQANFTGPQLPESALAFLKAEKFQNIAFINRLSMSSEDVNVNTKFHILLAVAEVIFDCCVVNDLVNLWWCCRALMIHQEILDELSPTLLAHADRFFKFVKEVHIDETFIKAELEIELTQMYLKFRHIPKCKELVEKTREMLGIEHSFSGKLGKRTKHQTKDVSQLALTISWNNNAIPDRLQTDNIKVPPNFGLDDKVRLDTIAFAEESEFVKIPNTEQKLIVTYVQQLLVATPPDELQLEEVLPFLQFVLEQKNTYCVRVATLLLRCRLESKHKRTIERCLKQCEELTKSFSRNDPPAANRVGDVYGTSLPPIWKIKTNHADSLLNYGLTQNALEIYLDVKLWEECIVCYTIMGRRKKAADVIKQELAKKPSVKFLCLLGDATDDISCYEKAWELSKRRSHRAQRHWAQYLFEHKRYEECIPHYEKSLSINPLQATLWFRLGYAALQVENWQIMATAYRRYTDLEPDSFEAWNNLAQSYLKIGNKRSAHFSIHQALKCNYDNWKIWENLLLVSFDISNYSDVILAYQRLLDLKEKYLNMIVIKWLVESVAGESENSVSDKNSTNSCLKKTRELLARIIAIYPNNGELWELHGYLAPELLLKAQRFQKAYRGYATTGWDKEPNICLQVLNICHELALVALDDEIDAGHTILSSIKLNITAALAVLKKKNIPDAKELIDNLAVQLEKIIEKISNAKVAFQIDLK